MSVCIISIYKIARKLGADISLSALVLCGVSALIINFMAIRVNPFLTKTYYYILGAMIILQPPAQPAIISTCYTGVADWLFMVPLVKIMRSLR